ncbi:NAD(P)/FAD-dependent oxidoreductase [Rickettsiales bacterium]|nr:NAD(P)/FAD-dependent oxidoreductase [Rickettsiales bacterium]
MKKKNTVNFYDAIIIGAGAAGLMCAIQAGKRGRKTLLLEGSEAVGKKIRISGGGRCNFTNLNIRLDNFLSQNSSFAISALKRFTQADFISLINKHQIAYHEKTLGQLFCDGSSQQIIDMLLKECDENNVKIILNNKVENIKKEARNFSLKTNDGDFNSHSLVIATGGLSIPKMGATDFGYKIAQEFGLKIIPPTPALVPFTLCPKILEETKKLAGVSVFASVKIGNVIFTEGLLFTHKGLSGPVILQISSYWKKGQKITINLAPKIDIFTWLEDKKNNNAKQDIHNLLADLLPKSLAFFILSKINIKGWLADLSNKKLKIIAQNINNWEVIPNGTEGFSKAEVTLGGVDSNEISSKTFESKKVKNLYFIGEVLDITGHLGGYNFQWSWSCGFAAGQFI